MAQSKTDLIWDLTAQQLCVLELLLNGGLSPLRGFMASADYNAVVERMKLADGTDWPLPVVLDVSSEFAAKLTVGDAVALRHPEGMINATIDVSEIWHADSYKDFEKTGAALGQSWDAIGSVGLSDQIMCLGGDVSEIISPVQRTFTELRSTPAELISRFENDGRRNVLTYKPDGPIHRRTVEQLKLAMKKHDAMLLLQPVTTPEFAAQRSDFIRIESFVASVGHFDPGSVVINLIPCIPQYKGSRGLMMDRIIARNFGGTHVAEDRQHYDDPDARRDMIDIEVTGLDDLENDPEIDEYQPSLHSEFGQALFKLSDDEVNRMISNGEDVPDWAVFPDVVGVLRHLYRPKERQGVTVFFTGLPCSGKSTLAMLLTQKLNEIGTRPVTLLDGDLVRKNLSSELGFSKEHRDINIRRIGYVASEITKNGGFAICAPIAPYTATRAAVRDMIAPLGGFIEIFVSTPLKVCEQRDVKGLYAQARAGKISNFTGVNDPYESPEKPELTIDASKIPAIAGVNLVLSYLEHEGYLPTN